MPKEGGLHLSFTELSKLCGKERTTGSGARDLSPGPPDTSSLGGMRQVP